MSNTTLHGVVLLSNIILVNQSLPDVFRVVDAEGDLTVFYQIGIAGTLIWLVGLGYASYYTDDDGYISGSRRIESTNLYHRIVVTLLTYFFECLYITSCVFGRAATNTLMGGSTLYSFSDGFIYNRGNYPAVFAFCVGAQALMMLTFVIPFILWNTLERSTFAKFANFYLRGRFGYVISFIQDCYMIYFCLPIMVQLLRSVPCTHYLTGEDATALMGTASCWGPKHRQYAITGICVAVLSCCVGVVAGTVPPLVQRNTDTALNGRYISMSYVIKMAIAVAYVICGERHRFYHLSVTLALQAMLVFLNISLRPCLVERVNFHRSAAFICSLVPTVMCLVAAILDDALAKLPLAVGVAFLCSAAGLLVLKYYTMVCGKLFPVIPFEDGMYEGDLCLGLSLPHGYGTITWDFEDKKFTGRFMFGMYHGYGVMTKGKLFFNGNFKYGLREGFGATNVMNEGDEESYEGFWEKDVYEGSGTKKYVDGDVYEGNFTHGKECGDGKWSFNSSLGRHATEGEWKDGKFLNVVISEEEMYEGETRYGVPHGSGKMTIENNVFEGEWRGGKLHGSGQAHLEKGEYEGNFFEGEFHDDGTWSDEHGTYTGKFRNGLKHGSGIEESDDGIYEGQYDNGQRCGYGTFNYSNGAVYQGSWRCNEFHGAGFLKTAELEYDGPFVNGSKHGARGHIMYSNGTEYLGGWANDVYEGEGVLRIKDLGDYQGKFENGKQFGDGKFTFFEGSIYVGAWQNGKAIGGGEFTFMSRRGMILLKTMDAKDKSLLTTPRERHFLDFGGSYKGNFDDGEFSGSGTVRAGDGTVYEGNWKNGMPHGKGKQVFPAGGTYIGDWAQGQREGWGTMEYVDKRVYEGEWSGGRRHGHGILKNARGVVLQDCEWVGDIPVGNAGVEMEYDVIPTVDVAELIRAIMPGASSLTDIEEIRERKRMEVEELYDAYVIALVVEEQLQFSRTAKSFMLLQHSIVRDELANEEIEASRQLQKSTLVKILNYWKASYKAEHDRDPKKSDIMADPTISQIYKKYMELAQK